MDQRWWRAGKLVTTGMHSKGFHAHDVETTDPPARDAPAGPAVAPPTRRYFAFTVIRIHGWMQHW